MQRKEVASHTYAANNRCSQGPIDAHFTATGAKWGESIEIYACGPRGVRALANVEVDGVWSNSGPVGFGERDNSRCVLRDAELAARAEGGGGGAAAARDGSGAAVTAGEPARSTPSTVQFHEVYPLADVCAQTMSTVLVLSQLEAGADIHVNIWSREPNDLDGASIKIVHNSNQPNVSDEKWEEHVAKQEAKRRKKAAEAGRDLDDEDWEVVDISEYTGPTSAPPTAAAAAETIPPRPSVHADWVTGYWHWNAEAWVWIAGQWRVPDSDVTGGYTVTAPHAPPELRVEVETSQATPDAVWAPGYWAWDGTAYIWIAGTWRLPPSAGVTWHAHGWRITTSGAVFVPGGWGR